MAATAQRHAWLIASEIMGRKTAKGRSKKGKASQKCKKPTGNFLLEAGPGCYIARREKSPDWLIEWEDIDPAEFEGEEVPDIAIDTDEQTLSMCNIENKTKIAYITIFETRVLGAKGQELVQGVSTDNNGRTSKCVTLIVLCPPNIFAHLCILDIPSSEDITKTRIESDVQEWDKHPKPNDEHPEPLLLPLQGGPFLCTQGENGELTHFFSGNLHAIDFRCPVGTPLVAVGDGVVVDAKDSNTLTGISVSNLFEWNSILLLIDTNIPDKRDGGELYVEYVHIQKALVKKGERVTKGQTIGLSGSVGFSPEPHLHFSAFRTSEPTAPTVRVRFQAPETGSDSFQLVLPEAGKWYG